MYIFSNCKSFFFFFGYILIENFALSKTNWKVTEETGLRFDPSLLGITSSLSQGELFSRETKYKQIHRGLSSIEDGVLLRGPLMGLGIQDQE